MWSLSCEVLADRVSHKDERMSLSHGPEEPGKMLTKQLDGYTTLRETSQTIIRLW